MLYGLQAKKRTQEIYGVRGIALCTQLLEQRMSSCHPWTTCGPHERNPGTSQSLRTGSQGLRGRCLARVHAPSTQEKPVRAADLGLQKGHESVHQERLSSDACQVRDRTGPQQTFPAPFPLLLFPPFTVTGSNPAVSEGGRKWRTQREPSPPTLSPGVWPEYGKQGRHLTSDEN